MKKVTPGRIVGVSGSAGSGKDTAADRLVSKWGFTKVALADPIKRYGMRVFHFSEEQLWGPSDFRNTLDKRFQDADDDAWTAALHRAELFNKEFVRDLFPDSPLLQAQGFSKLDAWLETLVKEHPRVSPRIMLQTLGTEWGRSVKSDVWINYAIRTSLKLLGQGGQEDLRMGFLYDPAVGLVEAEEASPPPGVVISDIRFDNELDLIKARDGFLVRILRPESDNAATSLGIQGHASEAEQKSFDESAFNYVINNKGTLKEFIEAVDWAGFILTTAAE